ncbi:nucleoside hydrolase [Streptomyces sp. WG4]|uniref:nucleoside hydrolase n=1 Tax=Streptomyces sp. WG4 TaxID=3417649 RepID=UPI003CFBB3D5
MHTEPVRDDLDVADFLAETVRASPGEVDVMAIGPLADLARTLQRHGDFAEAVGSAYLMGGSFGPDAKLEHGAEVYGGPPSRLPRPPTPVAGPGASGGGGPGSGGASTGPRSTARPCRP